MRYRITAQVVRTREGWTSSVGVPTFFLDADVQGIVHAAHAAQIARRMLQALAPDAKIHGSAIDEDTRADYADL